MNGTNAELATSHVMAASRGTQNDMPQMAPHFNKSSEDFLWLFHRNVTRVPKTTGRLIANCGLMRNDVPNSNPTITNLARRTGESVVAGIHSNARATGMIPM